MKRFLEALDVFLNGLSLSSPFLLSSQCNATQRCQQWRMLLSHQIPHRHRPPLPLWSAPTASPCMLDMVWKSRYCEIRVRKCGCFHANELFWNIFTL